MTLPTKPYRVRLEEDLEMTGSGVLIRVDEDLRITEGGLHLPETAEKLPSTGTVISVGPGKTDKKGRRIPCELREGDQVLFKNFAGQDLEIRGQRHVMILEEHVLGKLEG